MDTLLDKCVTGKKKAHRRGGAIGLSSLAIKKIREHKILDSVREFLESETAKERQGGLFIVTHELFFFAVTLWSVLPEKGDKYICRNV